MLVGPDDPEAMLRHTAGVPPARHPVRGRPVAAAGLAPTAPAIRRLVDGATYLFSNEYEAALIEQKTGWSEEEMLARVGYPGDHPRRGRCGDHVAGSTRSGSRSSPPSAVADPTGVGDAFRAGYLAGTAWGMGPQRCAQVGALVATEVLETVGTQEYELRHDAVLARFAAAYGDEAAAELAPHLGSLTD